MKCCKYCGNAMFGEFETNAQNHHKYKAFYICHKCHAVCDGEYMEDKKGKQILYEKWWNPITQEFENMG